MNGVEAGIFLLDFARQLRRKNPDVPEIYFALLDAAGISPTLILNQNAKLKREEAGSVSKSKRQKLQRPYTQGGAAYGSLHNLVKASSLSVWKMKRFLHSKPSYKKFTIATRKFKRMKAFAGFKNEIWCKDLAYVDELAKQIDGVKSLLVRQELFDRTVDARGMKKRDSKETVCAFLTMITKKNHPKKVESTKEKNLPDRFRNYAKLNEFKLVLQWMRLRLHLMNVQHDPWKLYFTVTWKTVDSSTFKNWLNSLQQ